MKKIVLTFACALSAMALFSACDRGEDVKEFKDENATVKALTIEATLPSVQGEGMKTAFTAKDFLRIRFAKADGTPVGRTQILKGEGAEGKTASFSNKSIAVPNDAETAILYVDNKETNLINYGSAPTVIGLDKQKGTLEDAVSHQVIAGTVAVSGISGGSASVSLAYKTGIVKIVASYPEGTTPKDGETTITLGGSAQYNHIVLPFDKPGSESVGRFFTALRAQLRESGQVNIPALAEFFTSEEISHLIGILQKPESLKNGTQALSDYCNIILDEAHKRAAVNEDPLMAAMEKNKYKGNGGKQTWKKNS